MEEHHTLTKAIVFCLVCNLILALFATFQLSNISGLSGLSSTSGVFDGIQGHVNQSVGAIQQVFTTVGIFQYINTTSNSGILGSIGQFPNVVINIFAGVGNIFYKFFAFIGNIILLIVFGILIIVFVFFVLLPSVLIVTGGALGAVIALLSVAFSIIFTIYGTMMVISMFRGLAGR